jgi:hypothetical protein
MWVGTRYMILRNKTKININDKFDPAKRGKHCSLEKRRNKNKVPTEMRTN